MLRHPHVDTRLTCPMRSPVPCPVASERRRRGPRPHRPTATQVPARPGRALSSALPASLAASAVATPRPRRPGSKQPLPPPKKKGGKPPQRGRKTKRTEAGALFVAGAHWLILRKNPVAHQMTPMKLSMIRPCFSSHLMPMGFPHKNSPR